MGLNVSDVLTLDDVRLGGKVVLYRVDVNSPLEPSSGAFLDDSRLRAIIPTLRTLQNSKVVMLGHQSRPGKIDFTNMEQHADRICLLYTSPSPRDATLSRMPSSA